MRTIGSTLYLLLPFLALFVVAACSASAQVVYVDRDAPGPDHDGTSWDTAFLTGQEGVNAATPGGEVWVADGAYVENVLMGEGVAIYGGFLGAEEGGYEDSLEQRDWVANIATIDGNQSGSCVVMAVQARVDGFTLINGSGTLAEYNYRYGGGMYCGGGIYCKDAGAAGVIANNTITRNVASNGDGGGVCCYHSSPFVVNNVVAGNGAGRHGGGLFCWAASPIIVNNTITANSSGNRGGGIFCHGSSSIITNNTIAGNASVRDHGGGIYCGGHEGRLTVANNIVTSNSSVNRGGGICCLYADAPVLRANDVWDNSPDNYYGCGPGQGDISADPLFANPDAGDFHLTFGSPCIDAGTNDAPGMSETDWDGEDRISNGIVDIGADEYLTYYTDAPDPQPECDGPLFGEPQAGFPGWIWFSIPLTPDCPVGSGCADPNALLGFPCNGRLWYWDKYGNWGQVYKPPFVEWELAVGNSFILYLEAPVTNPWYEGLSPYCPWEFEFKLGRQGWTWIGMPGLTELAGDDFMSSVKVKYPSDETGSYRTAQADYDVIPDNWITWGWPYWNTWLQAIETFTPYAPFEHNTCYPWVGYRAWINVGTAQSYGDPDQVTLIWPRQ